ncbi:class I SAM-dependent methyltransferase [bacterium]|nr:class I SAM-dependent methyltransferase [bacterium]
MKDRWIELIRYATNPLVPYSGQEFKGGYQQLKCQGVILPGQRDCSIRHEKLKIDWSRKVVLDIGCNQGGMLFEIASLINFGYGIDNNAHLINVCQKIRELDKHANLNFFVMDIEDSHFATIECLLEHQVDVCILMAMCSWLTNWREVIEWCCSLAPVLVFETNGNPELQDDHIAHVRSLYNSVEEVASRSDDDHFEWRRRCYVCRNQ